MNRPFFIMVLFYILGIISARYFQEWFSVLVLILIVLSACYFLKSFFNLKILTLILIFYLIGLFLTQNALFNKDKYLESIVGEEVQITGKILDKRSSYSGFCKATLNVNETLYDKEIYTADYKISVEMPDTAEISQMITVNGRLENLGLPSNIGGYNEKLYLFSDGIRYKLKTNSLELHNIIYDFNYYLNKIKLKTVEIYDKILPPNESAVMQSMILGYDEGLSDETRELYKTSGIYHILSISGLHILILSEILIRLLENFIGRKKSSVITLLLIFLYCIFTGINPATVRAVIMFTVVTVGNLIYQESDLLTSLAFSAFIILLFSPLYLFKVGFQLSFSAVLGMGLFNEPVERLLFKIFRIKNYNLIQALSAMISANLIVTYISMFHFYRFYPYFLFANLIILPTSSFILLMGIAVLIIGFINIHIAMFFSGAIYYILVLYEKLSALLSVMPFSSILGGRPGLVFTTTYFSALLLLYLYEKNKNFVIIYKFTLVLSTFVLLIQLLLPEYTKIAMLDVSQGDSFIIRNNKKVFVIDCGDRPNVLLNYLDYYGINNIEAIFLSHTDKDHSGAVFELIQNKNIKNIFLPYINYDEDSVHDFIFENADFENYDIHYLMNGDIINSGDLKFYCLSPKDEKIQDSNEGSMVLKFEQDEISFLFTGDIGFETEQSLLNENIKADVLKIAHHGSAYSSDIEFLERVQPKLCLISVGKNNYGHPNNTVLDKINSIKSDVLRTDLDGAVYFETDGKELRYTKMLGDSADPF